MKKIIAIAALALILVGQASAQTFKVLHTFTGGAEGSFWGEKIAVSGNTLFGTRYGSYYFVGSTNNPGIVYSVNTDGSGYTVLHSFTGGTDGANPGSAVLSSNTLYGTTSSGGSTNNYGTIYAVNTDGTGYNVLYSFTGGTDGAHPGSAVLSGNTLYGLTTSGGPNNGATIFAVNTDGSGFHTVYSFNGADMLYLGRSLIIGGNTLYGTGFAGSGETIFAVNTDGSGYQTIHSFTNNRAPLNLILSGNTLYGEVNIYNNNKNIDSIFSINTDGSGFKTVYTFPLLLENSNPLSISIVESNTIYGQVPTAAGTPSSGSIFALNTDGTGFKRLHSFTSQADGSYPHDVTLLGSTLYGAASYGGAQSNGTVFSIALGALGTQQTISFTTPPARTYSPNASFILSATASSGLPVSYSSSNTNVAVVSSNIVTIMGAGNTSITASQSGDSTYSAATPIARVLKVSQGSQTINFGKPASVTYGDVPSFNLMATNSSGLQLTFKSSNAKVATVSGSMVTITGAGNTAITASQTGTSNYKPAAVNQVLTVNKANQTISFSTPASEPFTKGGTFSLSATATSGLTVTFKSSKPDIISIAGTTATIKAKGAAILTATQAGNGNYKVATPVAIPVTVQ